MKEIDNGLLNHVSGGSIASQAIQEAIRLGKDIVCGGLSDFQSGKDNGELIKNSIVRALERGLERGLEVGADWLYGKITPLLTK
ncbi:hypothetical protein [Xenorhabdus anantnagensis]|nr:hypothetical protein [Xenorhabdus anantnagensis]